VSTVLLVGAGAVGARAARQLVETPGITRVLVADRRRNRADGVVGAMGRTAAACDWFGDEPLPEGVDAVAAAVPGALDVAVARHAIEAGIPCATASDDAAGLQELIALDAPARAAGTTVVAGAGLAPGLSDVLARHAADALDAVDEVTVARAGVSGPASIESMRRARRERAAIVADGSHELLKGRSGHELVWFPDPVGARECEPVAPGVELLAAEFPEATRVAVSWGETTSGSRLRWPAREDPEGTWGAIRVEVWGRRGAAREVLVYGAIERTAIATGTVLAVATAGLVGASPYVLVRRPGVHGLGTLVRTRPFLAELATRGVKAAAFEGVPVA
jgi:hypothetical protein